MFCQKCGAEIAGDCTFCTVCGAGQGVAPKHSNNPNQKSRWLAGIFGVGFGLLLGGVGVHNFYLGFTTRGVWQAVLTGVGILTAWVGLGILMLMASAIWSIIEGIVILCKTDGVDAHGVPLKNTF